MERLTVTQQEIVDFVAEYVFEVGEPPTYDEIATGIGVAVRAVQYQLDKLEEAGVVKRERRNGRCVPRSLEVVS